MPTIPQDMRDECKVQLSLAKRSLLNPIAGVGGGVHGPLGQEIPQNIGTERIAYYRLNSTLARTVVVVGGGGGGGDDDGDDDPPGSEHV